MSRASTTLGELEQRLALVESARASVKGTAAVALYLLVAMSVIAWWGVQAGQHVASAFVVAAALVSVGWRLALERRAQASHTEAEWMQLLAWLRWSGLPSALAWCVASLAIFPHLTPLASIGYLFALSLAFSTGAVHMASATFTAAYIGLQIGAVLLASAAHLRDEPLAAVLLLSCWMLWVAMARTTIRRISSLASKIARTALARRLWSDRAQRRVRAAEVRSAEARSRAAESRALFVARVSHELRTPLQTIVSGLEALHQRTAVLSAGDPKLAALLDRLARTSDQVLALSHDLADFVRWENGTLPVRLIDVEVSRLVDDIATGLAERARLRGVDLIVEHSGTIGSSRTDAARLRAIVTNLLTNAIKYAPNGRVLLGTERRADGALVITVQDNGPGLPASVLEVLGSPWVRGDNARVQEEGFGLGLSIVMTLAQEIGLGVRVDPANPGTRFSLTLGGQPATRELGENV